MLFFFLLLFSGEGSFQLLESVSLNTNHRVLFGISAEKTIIGKDGSYVIATEHDVWHYNKDGSIRLKFGRKGEGPVEFQYIYALTWDGSYYWVVDGMRLATSQIDNKGHLVKRHHVFYENFSYKDDLMIATMGDPIKQLAREQPKMLYQVNPEKGLIKTGKPFHQLSTEAVNLFYNYMAHFIAIDDFIYVIDQVRPSIYVYNKKTFSYIKEIRLALPGFVFPPNDFFQPVARLGRPTDHRKFEQWENSWSRITGFTYSRGGFILTFERPDQQKGKVNILCKLNREGQPLKEMPIAGTLLGVDKDHIVLFVDWDDEKYDSPEYQIHVYKN